MVHQDCIRSATLMMLSLSVVFQQKYLAGMVHSFIMNNWEKIWNSVENTTKQPFSIDISRDPWAKCTHPDSPDRGRRSHIMQYHCGYSNRSYHAMQYLQSTHSVPYTATPTCSNHSSTVLWDLCSWSEESGCIATKCLSRYLKVPTW